MTQHELELICQNGEGQEVEFKRSINSDLSKELVAFANAGGGRIFIGIDDGGKVAGVQIDNESKSRVEVMARDCDPAVVVRLEVFENVLIVNVPDGKEKPYRCANGFYRRQGPSSVKLTTREIRHFFQKEEGILFEEFQARGLEYPDDLNEESLKRFCRLSGISQVVDPKQLLSNLGVLANIRDSITLNNAGALFFSNQLSRSIPHAAISCVLFKGNNKVYIIDRKILDFDLLTNIDQAVAFVERHIRLAYEIKDIRRKEILELPKEVFREAIINAVAHRDYFQRGAQVVVEIFDNRVVVSNPGGLPNDLDPEEFGMRSVARNPLISSLLHRCNYIENIGTGIQRMRAGMKEAGLSKPIFKFSGFFTVTLKKSIKNEAYLHGLIPVGENRLKRKYGILRQLHEEECLEIDLIARLFNTSSRSIRRDLEMLETFNWVISSGVTKDKSYSLTDETLDRMYS